MMEKRNHFALVRCAAIPDAALAIRESLVGLARTGRFKSGLVLSALLLSGCGDSAKVPEQQGYGASPVLPEPNKTLLPTIEVAAAVGWPPGGKPVPAPGLTVNALVSGLDHPRWLYVLPNGDVLVAETSAPPRAETTVGLKGRLKGWIVSLFMTQVGADVPSPDRITLLRENAQGGVETRSVFLEGLRSPFGMALIGDQFYVANTDAVMRFAYKEGDLKIAGPGIKVADLPAGPINHHWTKDIIANPNGTKLYVSVGSNSNVGENGMEAEVSRADVLEVEPETGSLRVFASGLRNPNGLSWQPKTGALWVAVNERDELGSDLVPDYMTALKEGAFYGWPYSYYGKHLDKRVSRQRPDLVAKAIAPDYALGAHTASLGLTFCGGKLFPMDYQGGAFIGQHGSWNRRPFSGYKVIFVPFADGMPSGAPKDILTGFSSPDGKAWGRPVGVKMDKVGALLVADDVGNTVWRVTPSAAHN